jgi:hypothetical protein
MDASKNADQKYLESLETWCFRSVEQISLTNRVRHKEVLHRVKEKRNILPTIQRKKKKRADWILLIWRMNCLLTPVFEGDRKEEKTRK